MNRKVVILAVAIVSLFALMFAALYNAQGSNNGDDSLPESKTVVVDLTKHAADIPVDRQFSIRQALYETISVKQKKDSYNGILRAGSYKKKIIDSSTTITFLVDIDYLKSTYAIELDEEPASGYKATHISCAPDKDQLTHPSECKSVEN